MTERIDVYSAGHEQAEAKLLGAFRGQVPGQMRNRVGGGTAGGPPSVASALDLLHGELEALQDRLGLLRQRLQPILDEAPVTTKPEGIPFPEGSCALSLLVLREASYVRGAKDVIEEIIGAVRL